MMCKLCSVIIDLVDVVRAGVTNLNFVFVKNFVKFVIR